MSAQKSRKHSSSLISSTMNPLKMNSNFKLSHIYLKKKRTCQLLVQKSANVCNMLWLQLPSKETFQHIHPVWSTRIPPHGTRCHLGRMRETKTPRSHRAIEPAAIDGEKWVMRKLRKENDCLWYRNIVYTLQGINISYLGKRKIIFKSAFLWDMLVPRRVYYRTYISYINIS